MTADDSSALEALKGLDPAREVFPGITAGDLVYAMSPRPADGLRAGTAAYRPGGDPAHRLRWYAPPGPGPHPAVLFVHSGSWSGGDASMYLRYASDLATRGFVAATMDYRLVPRVAWPGPLEDVRAAVAWMRADAPGLGVDPAALALAGASAGGHLAAMAALDPVDPVGPGDVAAAVLWYPPLRLGTMASVPGNSGVVRALLGGLDAARLAAASPMTHVWALAPPTLTMTGECDPICPEADARAFHERLTAFGVPNQLAVVGGAPHGFDMTRRWYEASFEGMAAFLSAVLVRG